MRLRSEAFPQELPRFLGSDVESFVRVSILSVRIAGLIALSSAAETERRQAFRDTIVGQLPFDLIGMDETLPSVEISVSGGEGTNNHRFAREERY